MDENLVPSAAAGLGLLSSSPRSSILFDHHPLLHNRDEPEDPACGEHDHDQRPAVRLHDFVDSIPSLVQRYKALPRCDDGTGPLSKPILDRFGRVELPQSEWERYAVIDPSKSYTRNLVATDHQTYTLLVLVWTPGKASAIHDHPCDGCWMRVLKGSIRESRYAAKKASESEGAAAASEPATTSCLECIHDAVYHEGQVTHIEDCMGYHKIENPSPTTPAVTMHLYSPPFERCRVWLDEHSAESRSSWVRYDSEYGNIPAECAKHNEAALISL